MAEVAGLFLGVAALLGTFKDCIDLFSYISAAKSLGNDYEILNTKLDIEKTLLLQWADRVRLLHPYGYDRRLDDPVINKAVFGILSGVQLLLSKSTDLQQRYGMKCVDAKTAVIPTISGPRMNQFLHDFESLTLRIDATQKEASVKQRFCWVVKDKEKFSGLVQELSYLVAKLNAIMPAAQDFVDIMTKKDLEGIRNLRHVQLVLEAAKEHETAVADLAQETITEICQERVLERLWYRMIDDRKNNVADAHLKTLQWALHPPTPEVEWDDLSEWLRSGSDIFWVSGKAGSGKSTLIKYLYQHKETETLLKEWAGSHHLIMANFFFWHLGTPEQKTHEGLSGGLLYHVLNADPSLIPLLLPNMWREAHKADKAHLDLPSASEMGEAFSTLRSQITKDRFCFFIDGLDEYSGNHISGISFIRSLVSSGNIKVIVSSRPIPACVQAFSCKQKLQLQDLTRGDIKTYVDDTIGSHPHTQDLMAMDPVSVKRIIGDLVERASGVFLWVVLACRSLLEGFAAFDYPEELQRRVDELPPELESLFKHMLSKIEPRYQNQAAKLLRVCYQRRVNPEVEPHYRAERRISEGVYTLGLALVDEYELDMARFPDLRELSLDERRMKCRVLEARLRSRCCGLLEVHWARGQYERCFCGHDGGSGNIAILDGLVDSMVEFMHRSVFEFLSNPEVWNLDCLQTGNANFQPNAVLSRMNLHLLYISSRENNKRRAQINEMARESLLCAKYADLTFSEAMPILPYFSRVAFEIIEILKASFEARDDYPFFAEIKKRFRASKKAETHLALLLAVELGMVNVVRHWETLGIFSHAPKWPLLYHAIDRPFSSWLPSFGLDVSPEMIAFLLSKDCDPNTMFLDFSRRKTTPWKFWLLVMQSSTDRESASLAAEVTELFLNAGADVNIPISELKETIESLIERRLLGHHGREIDFNSALTRNERAMRVRCNDILQLVASKRIQGHAQMDTREHDPSDGLRNSDFTAPKALGLVIGKVMERGLRKRPATESMVPGELGLASIQHHSAKRERISG
jgi:hypothetical protein